MMNLKEVRNIESWGYCCICGDYFGSAASVRVHRANGHSKGGLIDVLSNSAKERIKKEYLEDKKSQEEIGDKFNVSAGMISHLLGELDCEIRTRQDYIKKSKKKCEYCGVEYTGSARQKYCSKKCRRLAGVNVDYFSVFYRDGFRCRYCGKTPADGIRMTVDHVYPQSKGGTNQKVNLVTACQHCNSHKSDDIWPKKKIKEIWWQNKKLQKETDDLEFEEIMREFKEEYPNNKLYNL